MHAHNLRPGRHRNNGGGNAGRQSFVGVPAREPAQRRFSRNTNHYRLPKVLQLSQIRKQLDIVRVTLAETEARINYLAVEPSLQRGGLGRELMEVAEKHLRAIGCPKINLQVRSSNTSALAFYEKLGFQIDEAVSLGKRLAGL